MEEREQEVMLVEYRTVDQSVTLSASPHEVYEMLMDSKRHAEFTGAPCEIGRGVGEGFVCYDGHLSGTTIELVPDRKIVRSWRALDWPEGHHSTATFLLESENGGTRLDFVQAGVPAQNYDSISKGWKEHYWDKMKAVVGS